MKQILNIVYFIPQNKWLKINSLTKLTVLFIKNKCVPVIAGPFRL